MRDVANSWIERFFGISDSVSAFRWDPDFLSNHFTLRDGTSLVGADVYE